MSLNDYPPTSSTAERICHSAATLFHEKGFHGASMQDLATAVGITKSSLYHHFASKQALLAAIIEVTMSRVTPLVREIAEADSPAATRLHRALAIHTAESIRERDYVACFSEESRYLSPDFMATHRQKKDRYESLFRLMVDDGISRGEFPPQDAALATMAILGMVDGVSRRYRPTDDHSPDAIAAVFADTALRSLGAPGLQPLATGSVVH
jgi:TetR/AcrR family transcriptional regulator, cholesterol catabolism regulator